MPSSENRISAGSTSQPSSFFEVGKEPRFLVGGLLLVFTVAYGAMAILNAERNLPYVDEVFVFWIAKYFPAANVFDALKMGLDGAAPGYYWLIDGFTAAFGQTMFAARLPSIVGIYLFALSVFLLLRRRVPWPIAMFALFAACSSGAAYAGAVARPYALVAGCFGLASVAWIGFPSGERRILRSVTTILALSFAMTIHFLAVLLVAALGLAELIRSWCDRRILWSYWACLAASGVTLLLWLPVVAPIYRLVHTHVGAPGFYAKPTLARVLDAFTSISLGTSVELMLIVFALLSIPLTLAVQGRFPQEWRARLLVDARPSGAFRDLDILAFAALTLPLIAFVFALLVTGVFNARHVLAAALGIILLAARGLAALRSGALLACVLLILQVGLMALLNKPRPPSVDGRIALLRHSTEALPVVLADGSDFFELSEMLPDTLRKRIVFVGVPAGSSSPDPEPEMIVWNWKAAIPALPVYTAAQWFAKSEPFYLLYTAGGREGLTSWLLTHAKMQPVANAGSHWLFKVDGGRSGGKIQTSEE